jgi:hypothetical protein
MSAAELDPIPSSSEQLVPEKKTRPKREMTPEMLEKLRLAREKALATRRDKKLLKEREELVASETIEARWAKLHEEEEKLKAIQPRAPPATEPLKKKGKSRIVHLSPPLPPPEESSEESESEEEETYEPVNSRRALLAKQRRGDPPPPALQQPPQSASQEELQLKRALKALGIRS